MTNLYFYDAHRMECGEEGAEWEMTTEDYCAKYPLDCDNAELNTTYIFTNAQDRTRHQVELFAAMDAEKYQAFTSQ